MIPDGYSKLPTGAVCKCPKMWRESNGSHWCCQPAMTAKADTNPLREALAVMARVKGIAIYANNDARDTYIAKLTFHGKQPYIAHFEALRTAALASEPVGAGTVRDGKCTFPDCRCISAPPCPNYAHRPLADPPAPAGREEIARVIDPAGWQVYDYYVRTNPPGVPKDDAQRRRHLSTSLDKADAILALGATVSPQVLCPTAETISACARSTLIGFRGELGDGNIAFICDQISRKSVLDCTPPAPGAADRAAVIEECAKVAESFKYSEETKQCTNNGARTYGNDEACTKIAATIRAKVGQ